MKVLITGGAGFIGSYLSNILAENGYEVIVLDKLSTQVHGTNIENSYLYNATKKNAHIIREDICNSKSLDKLITYCDYIVHLAAETGTGQSMYKINNYVNVNTFGTSVLLEKLVKIKNNVKKFILASSRAVYGEGRYLCNEHGFVYPSAREVNDMKNGNFECKCPICNSFLTLQSTDENSEVNPRSIYGLTKLHQEQLTRMVCGNIQLPYTIFRFQNVYGKGQSLSNPYTGILAIFSGLIMQNKEINIFEDGLESRDFIHVKDIARSLLADIESPVENNTYNLGSGINTTVLEIVELLKSNFSNTVNSKVSGSFRVGDIRHNFADISLAKEVLGYNQSIKLEDGIKEFSDWIKNYTDISSDNYEKSLHEMKDHNLYFTKKE